MGIKIISGGQTGIDRMALELARELGLATGGTAPRGYRTEVGPDPSLAAFGLREHIERDYSFRTKQNVLDGDATVLYGDTEPAGCQLTIDYAEEQDKPFLINPTPEELTDFIRENHVRVLNVAGNRASDLTPELLEAYRDSLREALLPFTDETGVTAETDVPQDGR